MRSALLFSLLALTTCADSRGGGAGGVQGPVANQTISNSPVVGGVTNTASITGGVTTGSGGQGGTSSQNIPVNLALDPSSFSTLFGHSPPIVAPTATQADTAKKVASASGNAGLIANAEKCLLTLSSCTISTVLGK